MADPINVYYVLDGDLSVQNMEVGTMVVDLKKKLFGEHLLAVELAKITFYTHESLNDKYKLKSVHNLAANTVDSPLYIEDKRKDINVDSHSSSKVISQAGQVNTCKNDRIAELLEALFNNKTKIMKSKLFGSISTFTKLEGTVKWNEGITTLYDRPEFYCNQFDLIEEGMKEFNGYYCQFGIGGVGKTAASLRYIIELGKRDLVLLYVCMGSGENDGARAYLLEKDKKTLYSSYSTNDLTALVFNIPDKELWVIVDAVNPILAIDCTSKAKLRRVLYVASGRMALNYANNIKVEPYFTNTSPVESISKKEFLQFGFESAYPKARKILLTGIDNSEELVNDPFTRELTKEETDKIHCRLAYMYDLFGGNIRHLLHCLHPSLSGGAYLCDNIKDAVDKAIETVDPKPKAHASRSRTRASLKIHDWNSLTEIRTACIKYVAQILSRFVTHEVSQINETAAAGATSLFFTIILFNGTLQPIHASLFMACVYFELKDNYKENMLTALASTIGGSGLGFLHEYSSIRSFLTMLRRGRTEFVAITKETTDKLALEAVDLYVTSLSSIQELSALQVGDFAISTNPCFPFIDGCVVLNNQESKVLGKRRERSTNSSKRLVPAANDTTGRMILLLQSTRAQKHKGSTDSLPQIKEALGFNDQVDKLIMVYLLDKNKTHKKFAADSNVDLVMYKVEFA